jgi:hypothetical protein
VASRDPRGYVTPWHGFHVNGYTRVVFVPLSSGVTHVCAELTPALNPVKIVYSVPSHAALPAGLCRLCNTLFVGLSEEEAHARLDQQANERPKEEV